MERQRERNRQWKASQRGTCAECGAETRYSGRDGQRVSPLCQACSARVGGEQRRGTGPVIGVALDYLAEPRTRAELAEHLGITGGYASMMLHRLLGYGKVRRIRRGLYVRT